MRHHKDVKKKIMLIFIPIQLSEMDRTGRVKDTITNIKYEFL